MKRLIFSKFLLLLVFTMIQTQQTGFSQSMSQGPLNPFVLTEESPGCLSCPGASWINHSNAMLPDSQYAATQMNTYGNCFMSTCYYARALMADSFSFNIPTTANITGIKVDVLRKASAPNTVYDTIVQLKKSLDSTGDNKANTGSSFPVSAAYISYGDSTDLWGTTWIPADINTNTFGVFFKPLNKNPNILTAYVDHIRVTAYYVTATGLQEQQSSSLNMFYDESSASLILTLQADKNSPALLKIYDSSGKLVLEKSFEKKMRSEKINLRELTKGIYIVKLSIKGEHRVLKFLINTD